MNANRVLNRKKTEVAGATEAIALMTNNKIRKMESLFDYSSLENIPQNDIEDLKEIEKELINQGEQLGKVSFEIGKTLAAAKKIFAEEETSFMAWYTAIGLSKDQVSLFIGRYNLVIEYPQAKDRILNLSDVTIKEAMNKKTPENIKEKVFSGEIKTAKEIKEARKKTSNVVHNIEEVQVISDLSSFNTLFEKINTVLNKKMHKITENGGSDYKNLEKFREIKEILDRIEV